MVEITRTPLTRDELECAVDLTERLVRLRQNECKHLAIENIGPEIFAKVLSCYWPPLIETDFNGSLGFEVSQSAPIVTAVRGE